MHRTAYINGKVLAGLEFREDLSVITESGRVAEIRSDRENPEPGTRIVDLAGDYLVRKVDHRNG